MSFHFCKLILIFYWSIMCIACIAQNETDLTVKTESAFEHISKLYNSQKLTKNNSIQQIDSIAHTSEPIKYFCDAYSRSMQNISSQIEYLDSTSKEFIETFEKYFADYFLRAWKDN